MMLNMTKTEAKKLGYEFGLLEDDTYTLTGIPTTVEHIEVPSSIDGKLIKKLSFMYGGGKNLKYPNKTIKTIIISTTVEYIGYKAFCGCTNLTSIVISENINTIGILAFLNCENLITLRLPNSVKIIKRGAFRSCTGLTSVVIPNSVTSIGDRAFANCSNLESFAYPCDAELGELILGNCPKLKTIEYL